MTLADFLLARIADDERFAKWALEAAPGEWEFSDRGWMSKVTSDGPAWFRVAEVEQQSSAPLQHVAIWQPLRVLAECEAKRRVLALLATAEQHLAEVRRTAPEYRLVSVAEVPRDALLRAVQCLALPYADDRDFRPEWRA